MGNPLFLIENENPPFLIEKMNFSLFNRGNEFRRKGILLCEGKMTSSWLQEQAREFVSPFFRIQGSEFSCRAHVRDLFLGG